MALKPIKQNMSLSEKAYQTIRNAIILSELSANDVLTEERLCEELSISRTPLRTALHRLVDEGLAEVRGKSITVTSMTEQDAENIGTVRLPIEMLVMQELVGKVTPTLLKELHDSVGIQQRCSLSTANDYMDYIQQDYRFHTSLANATGNRYLYDLSCRVNTHSNRFLMLSSTLVVASRPATAEHLVIIEALEDADYERAKLAMQLHLRGIRQRSV